MKNRSEIACRLRGQQNSAGSEMLNDLSLRFQLAFMWNSDYARLSDLSPKSLHALSR